MAETYEIFYDKQCVGTATMKREGLYLCFSCRCRLPDNGLYRIHVTDGDRRGDLGICVPMDDNFGMDKKLPAKGLGEGILRFELLPKDWKPQEITITEPDVPAKEETSAPEEEPDFYDEPSQQFLPVSEDEPFDYLDKLENAHMEIRDDQPGIVLDQIIEM